MKTFFRIINDKLHGIQVDNIGFSIDEPQYLPDEYLDKGKFLVMRTCHGLGDWVLLSAIPRLLKTKYPDCKVYIPSQKLLKKIFGTMLNNWGYGTFDASQVPEIVFSNNPYVDDFVDEYNDEVFHDHFKIYDENNDKISLVKQMLTFYQFENIDENETQPDFYESDKEKKFIDSFLIKYNLNKFNYISVSSTFEKTANTSVLTDKVKEYDTDTWLYYGEVPIQDSVFNFLDNVLEIKDLELSIRQQQSLKIRSGVNFGNETGMNLWTPSYSKTYVLGNTHYGPLHGGNNEGKVRKRPFKSGNFVNGVNYL